MKTSVVDSSFTFGSFVAYRCANWDCSGEQFFVGEYASQEEAHDACLADQAGNPNSGYSIERQDEASITVVEQIQGQAPKSE